MDCFLKGIVKLRNEKKLIHVRIVLTFQVATPGAVPTPTFNATPVDPLLTPGLAPGVGPRGGKGVVLQTPTSTPKVKKGVKRKADLASDSPASGFDPPYTPGDKAAKVGTRRESGRQIKKVACF